MLVTLSLSNTSRARSCAFAFASSASVMPVAPHAIELVEQRRFDRRERRAVVGRRRHACRETDRSVGISAPDTDDASPRSTSARYSRALRCGGGTRKLDQRFSPFAPVSTASRISSGKNSRSVADGA